MDIVLYVVDRSSDSAASGNKDVAVWSVSVDCGDKIIFTLQSGNYFLWEIGRCQTYFAFRTQQSSKRRPPDSAMMTGILLELDELQSYSPFISVVVG